MIKAETYPVIQNRAAKIFAIMFFLCVLSVFRLTCPFYAFCDDVTENPFLSVCIDPEIAYIGDIVEISLKYQLPEGANLDEEPEISGIEGLSILKTETAPGSIKINILVDQLEVFKSGKITLYYLDKDGQKRTIESGPVSFSILSNLGEKPAEAELKPIQGIIPTKSILARYLPWAGGLLLAVIPAMVLYWWIKKRKSNIENGIKVDPPYIRAINEIEILEKQGLFEKGEIKPFYFRFSEIIKHYVESIRHFPAAEFTTEEISCYLTSETDRRLLLLLRQADLVKFADTIPTSARKEEDVTAALAYINETASENMDSDYLYVKREAA